MKAKQTVPIEDAFQSQMSLRQSSNLNDSEYSLLFEEKISLSSIENSKQRSYEFFPEFSQADEGGQGYPLDRFPDELDQFFICIVCEKVVFNPRECVICQNLVCAGCIGPYCPYGCEELDYGKPSKFAEIFYNRSRIRCSYHKYGCETIVRIKDLDEHESSCSFRPVKCQNSVCEELIVLDDPEQEGVVCSDICRITIDFAQQMPRLSHIDRLETFVQTMLKTRKLLASEIKDELFQEFRDLDSMKHEAEKFLVRREKLNLQLQNAKKFAHKGIWQPDVRRWSCCSNRHKFAQGCIQLS